MNNNDVRSWLQTRAVEMQNYCLFRRDDQSKPISLEGMPSDVQIVSADVVMAHKDAILAGFTKLKDRKLQLRQQHVHQTN